jgi:thioredoxin-related protein
MKGKLREMLNLIGKTGVALLMTAMMSSVFAGGLPLVSNLSQDGQLSERTGKPIMVFYMSTSCPYCEEVQELYLEPMYRESQYREKLIMRMVNIDSADYMRDFRGQRTDHISFADAQGTSFTPVIKFYDATGKELVPEMLGYVPDFFLGYLEASIRESITKLRQRKTAQAPRIDPAS